MKPTLVFSVVSRAMATGLVAFSLLVGAESVAAPGPGSAAHFDTLIAPLLSRHCLECHDTSIRRGKFDLSRLDTALGKNSHGDAYLVPGNAEASLLWQSVESDEMPEDRPPLSKEEKTLLREWIDSGAKWYGDAIDPLSHLRDQRAADLWVARLTRREYIETVRASTGVDITEEALSMLPAEARADGFTNTAYNLNVDLTHIEAYARLAPMIVRRMDLEFLFADHLSRRETSDEGLREAIGQLGQWLLRGPLLKEEVDLFFQVASRAKKEEKEFTGVMRPVIEAMLQSPRFVYRLEVQRGNEENRLLSGFELASRMSYILWGGPPDKELARAAAAGELATREGMAVQVERLLADPRALTQSTRFLEEWLNLDRLANLSPDPKRFPRWNRELASDMREETISFFREVVWEQKRPLADLFNAQFSYVTPRLAAHYGLDHETGGENPALDTAKSALEPRGLSHNEYPTRVTEGLVAFYSFEKEGGGDRVVDRSGAGSSIDLTITEPGATRWSENGLEILRAVRIESDGPPAQLIESLKKSASLTFETWITPANATQAGPARILTLSKDSGARNFTIGQEKDRFEVRFRGDGGDNNGLPAQLSEAGSAVRHSPHHLVYTREKDGSARLYVDGQRMDERPSPGALDSWDTGFRLALGDEFSGDRAWLGTYHLAAIYDKALNESEIRRNHAAGPRSRGLSPRAEKEQDKPGAPGSGPSLSYRFREAAGDRVVADAGGEKNLDLHIQPATSVSHSPGALRIESETLLRSGGPPRRWIDEVRRSGALSVQLIVTPPTMVGKDLARVLSLSQGTSNRNFTFGHDEKGFEIRLRTSKTDRNGMPGLKVPAPEADDAPWHLVFTRDAGGRAVLFVNGREHGATDIPGDLKNWDDSYSLLLANETTLDRLWAGTYHRVGLWSRALSAAEVAALDEVPVRRDFTNVPSRGGLLTQGSLLTIGGDEASTVARGLFVLHDVLASGVTSAPPGTDTTPIHAKAGQSRRGIAEVRLASKECSGCHAKFEPLSFALEKFDGLGTFSVKDEHGNEQREDGKVLFPGESEARAYNTVAELMDLLAGHDRVRWNLSRKVTQFALGRPLLASDENALRAIHEQAQRSGGTYSSLVTAIVFSELVRETPLEPLTSATP